jgi:hypothetical protein
MNNSEKDNVEPDSPRRPLSSSNQRADKTRTIMLKSVLIITIFGLIVLIFNDLLGIKIFQKQYKSLWMAGLMAGLACGASVQFQETNRTKAIVYIIIIYIFSYIIGLIYGFLVNLSYLYNSNIYTKVIITVFCGVIAGASVGTMTNLAQKHL